MELMLSEQHDWYWPGVANQIRGLSGKGLIFELLDSDYIIIDLRYGYSN